MLFHQIHNDQLRTIAQTKGDDAVAQAAADDERRVLLTYHALRVFGEDPLSRREEGYADAELPAVRIR